ncbi:MULTISPECIES: MFS transporter [Micromonospora]|uniref:Major Facilitator Superfamily protein n=1 Tax=Micromonospora yangpuensis TaxID=683228 RepID=A0A1C6V8Q5_9ACTN|nr:MFS transporter [Micromonospora yangpuensis]GGM32443.1 MFS transporter [Micromonospora yangpuensis]SCL62645.1 Major Facilitator Superfamily protein [Micromonospora yangpuensis]
MRTVLRHPDFRLLFVALAAGRAAESTLLLALAIWVKDLTGSDGLAGATLFVIIAPKVLAPLVGWVIDRYRRRPFLAGANLVAALVLVPLLAVRDAGDVWLVYLVAGLYSFSQVIVNATVNGLIRTIVPAGQLADANAALQTVRQGLRLVGPLAGAALYAAAGGWLLTSLSMVGFGVAAVLTGLLRVPEPVPSTRGLGWSAQLGSGLRHLADQPALRRALLGLGLASLVMGFTESLIFAYVDQGLRRDAAFVSVLVTVQGVGGIVGGLLSARVVRRIGEVGTIAVGVGLFGAATSALAYPDPRLGFAALLVTGAALPLSLVGLNTLVQAATPAGLLGRVTAATDSAVGAPQAVSIGVGALLVGVLDYRLLFLLVSVVTVAAGGFLWRGRRLSPPVPPVGRTTAPTPTGAALTTGLVGSVPATRIPAPRRAQPLVRVAGAHQPANPPRER